MDIDNIPLNPIDIVEEVVPSVSLISAIAVLGTIVIFRRN